MNKRTAIAAACAGAVLVGISGCTSTTAASAARGTIIYTGEASTRTPPVATLAPSTSSAPSPSASSKPAIAKPVGIGGSIVLAGSGDGEQLTVTVVKVFDPTKATNEFEAAAAGHRLVGVQLRIVDTGTVPYKDSASNGAKYVDTQGQSFEASFSETTAGPGFAGELDLAPGETALGVIAFEVPTASKGASVKFALDSGFAPQTGLWHIS